MSQKNSLTSAIEALKKLGVPDELISDKSSNRSLNKVSQSRLSKEFSNKSPNTRRSTRKNMVSNRLLSTKAFKRLKSTQQNLGDYIAKIKAGKSKPAKQRFVMAPKGRLAAKFIYFYKPYNFEINTQPCMFFDEGYDWHK